MPTNGISNSLGESLEDHSRCNLSGKVRSLGILESGEPGKRIGGLRDNG
jgi:hypothetical protein